MGPTHYGDLSRYRGKKLICRLKELGTLLVVIRKAFNKSEVSDFQFVDFRLQSFELFGRADFYLQTSPLHCSDCGHALWGAVSTYAKAPPERGKTRAVLRQGDRLVMYWVKSMGLWHGVWQIVLVSGVAL